MHGRQHMGQRGEAVTLFQIHYKNIKIDFPFLATGNSGGERIICNPTSLIQLFSFLPTFPSLNSNIITSQARLLFRVQILYSPLFKGGT